jgi:hypothetical protein
MSYQNQKRKARESELIQKLIDASNEILASTEKGPNFMETTATGFCTVITGVSKEVCLEILRDSQWKCSSLNNGEITATDSKSNITFIIKFNDKNVVEKAIWRQDEEKTQPLGSPIGLDRLRDEEDEIG